MPPCRTRWSPFRTKWSPCRTRWTACNSHQCFLSMSCPGKADPRLGAMVSSPWFPSVYGWAPITYKCPEKITMGTENIRSNGIRADSYYMSVASEQTGLRLKLPGCKSDNFGVWWLKLCECELFQRELCPSTLWLSKFKMWTLRVWTLWISASLFLCVIGLWDHSIRSRHILA